MLFTGGILLAVIWSRNKKRFETRNDQWFNMLLQSVSRRPTKKTRDPHDPVRVHDEELGVLSQRSTRLSPLAVTTRGVNQIVGQ